MDNEITYKLRHIFLPSAALSLLLLAVYSAINWFMLSRTDLLDEDVIDYWLPLLAAVILELAIILPRVSRLNVGKKNMPFLFNCVALAMLAGPAMLAQTYIRASGGEITHVSDAAMISKAAQTRYYAADTICLNTLDAGGKSVVRASGSANQYLDFTIYAVIPVCTSVVPQSVYVPSKPQLLPPLPSISLLPESPRTPLLPAPVHDKSTVWIVLKFQKSIDNGLSLAEKNKAYSQFADQTIHAVNTVDPSKYRYLEHSGRNSDRHYYDQALASAGIIDSTPDLLLIPHTEPFAQRKGDWLTLTFVALVSGLVIWLVMVLLASLDEEKVQAAQRGEKHGTSFGNFVIPSSQSYGLAVLIDVNVIVFLAMVIAGLGLISFDTPDLIAWGGNYGPALQKGEFYRLISSQFVHGGIMHLANNMYGLCIAGLLLSPVLPNWRLILCYLVTGLGGSIASAVLHPNTVSVGASGAILGLWGVLVALALLGDARLAAQKNFILRNGALFVVLTMAMGSFTPGIDNAAHIAGFMTGALLGSGISLFGRYRTQPSEGA